MKRRNRRNRRLIKRRKTSLSGTSPLGYMAKFVARTVATTGRSQELYSVRREFEGSPQMQMEEGSRAGTRAERLVTSKRKRTLQLHSVHIWVTSPSVNVTFIDSQSLSQSPKYVNNFGGHFVMTTNAIFGENNTVN